MTNLVVGCPLMKRGWVLPTWFHHVMRSCDNALLSPEFVFVVPRDDDDSLDALERAKHTYGRPIDTILTDEPVVDHNHHWMSERYHQMVILRNLLLQRVRQMAPIYFWSLDSDLLPAEEALSDTLGVLEKDHFDAVGMLAYMTPLGTDIASKGSLQKNRLTNRKHLETAPPSYPVDVIMASKVMTSPAYRVDYIYHSDGEDVGWSLTCKEAGLKLGWNSRAACKHVMKKQELSRLDPRVGF